MNNELMMDRKNIVICRKEDDLIHTCSHMTITSMFEGDSRDACYYYVITMSVHDSGRQREKCSGPADECQVLLSMLRVERRPTSHSQCWVMVWV